MKYKELFCSHRRYIGIALDPYGLSICSGSVVKKTWQFELLARIQQPELLILTPSGIPALNIESETIQILKNTIKSGRFSFSRVSLSVPSFCVFRRNIRGFSPQEIRYLIDTESPWAAKHCIVRRQNFCQNQPWVWAIPRDFSEILDHCFTYRVKISYDVLDVNLLAWMRFWMIQQKFSLQELLHPYVAQSWPVFWYAPAIGTAWNAYVCT